MLKYLKCQTAVYLCVRVQDSFHRQRSPSLEREAYLLRLRRMKKYGKMPRKYWYISHLIHPKWWYPSLPLEATSAKPNVVGTHEVVEGVFCSPTRTVR